jgi:hypothetical protein
MNLDGHTWDRWTHLLHRLILLQLTDLDDSFKWNLTPSSPFLLNPCTLTYIMATQFTLKKYLEDEGTF